MSLFRAFRVVAVAEAVSWLGLLVGMYFKHLATGDEIGVRVFGPIHGALFVAYCACVLLLARERDWSMKYTVVGLIAAVPPLATLWFERRVARRERRAEPAPAAAD